MRIHRRWIFLLLLVLAPISLALLWSRPTIEARYLVQTIGPDDDISADVIDASGRAAGWEWGPKPNHVTIYIDDGRHIKGWIVPSAGFPLEAMNNHGYLVGKCETPGIEGTWAFRLHKARLERLPSFGGRSSRAFGINDAGDVAGAAATPDQNKHACVWRKGPPVRLRTPPGWTGPSEARDINDHGDIVGNVTKWSGESQGVLWRNGKPEDLGGLPGRPWVEAIAVNDRRQVIGWVGPNGPDRYGDVPFFWENGKMRRLPGGRRENLTLYGMNNAGVAVGAHSPTLPVDFVGWTRGGRFFVTGISPARAVIWENGQMHDLNNLVAMEKGRSIEGARAINDRGQIVGTEDRGQLRAILLTPVTVKE